MRGILAALLVAMAVFLVVGCGGSSNDAAATTEAVDTSVATDTMADTSTEATTDTTADTDTTASDDTSTTATGLSEGCQAVADFSTEFSKALDAAGASGSSADLEASAKAYEAAADKAPEEIRDAFKTLARAYAAYAKALDGVDLSSGATPSPAMIAKLVKASKELNTTGLATATTDISNWVSKNCTGGSSPPPLRATNPGGEAAASPPVPHWRLNGSGRLALRSQLGIDPSDVGPELALERLPGLEPGAVGLTGRENLPLPLHRRLLRCSRGSS